MGSSKLVYAFRLALPLAACTAAVSWGAPPAGSAPRSEAGPRVAQQSQVAVSAQPSAVEPAAADDEPVPGALLDSIEQQNRLITGAIRAEVENQLREARRRWPPIRPASSKASSCCSNASDRRLNSRLKCGPNCAAQLETALREANRRAATKEILDQQAEEARAADADRLRITDALRATPGKAQAAGRPLRVADGRRTLRRGRRARLNRNPRN